jgi:hypothetical protein
VARARKHAARKASKQNKLWSNRKERKIPQGTKTRAHRASESVQEQNEGVRQECVE